MAFYDPAKGVYAPVKDLARRVVTRSACDGWDTVRLFCQSFEIMVTGARRTTFFVKNRPPLCIPTRYQPTPLSRVVSKVVSIF